MTAVATDRIGPVLREYVEAAAAALQPERVIYTQPGVEVAWDEACGGQLAGRVVALVPHVSQPRGAAGVGCGVDYWTATLAMSMIRCIAVLDDDGTAPTPAAITADGQAMLADLAALEQVILCNPRTTAVLNWQPQGPDGGYAGGEWIFAVRIPTCGCSPVSGA